MRLALAIVLLAVGWASASAQPVPSASGMAAAVPPDGRIAFRVVREEVDIGSHVLTFRHDNAQLTVDIEVDLKVTAFGYTLYTYRHRATETWRDNRIVSFKTETDDNGTKSYVIATARESGLDVEVDGKRKVLPAGFLPTSHWNPAWLRAEGLLNTNTGEPVRPKIAGPTKEKIATERDQIEAVRYTVTAPRQAEIWFDANGRWVKSKFVAVDGSIVEYILK